MKDGREMPWSAVIQAIARSEENASAATMGDQSSMAGPSAGGMSSGRGGATGGVMGGPGGAVGAATGTVASTTNTVGNAAGGSVSCAGSGASIAQICFHRQGVIGLNGLLPDAGSG